MGPRRRVRGEDKEGRKTRERGGETERTRGDRGECGYVTASPISRDDGERNNPTVTVNMRHCEGNEKHDVVVYDALFLVFFCLFLSRVCVCVCVYNPRSEMAAEYG